MANGEAWRISLAWWMSQLQRMGAHMLGAYLILLVPPQLELSRQALTAGLRWPGSNPATCSTTRNNTGHLKKWHTFLLPRLAGQLNLRQGECQKGVA